jgi:ISXO2-like transposase domain
MGTVMPRTKVPIRTWLFIDATTGAARSAIVPDVTASSLRKAIEQQVDMRPSVLVTELKSYASMSDEFTDHIVANHSWGQYVNHGHSTNAVESFFAQMKRSVDGTHHHVSTVHLRRYLGEFDFRHTTRAMKDSERAQKRCLVDPS